MDVEHIQMKFRDTLTPASGFQSAQYRKIEFASTELIHLIDFRFRELLIVIPLLAMLMIILLVK